MIRERVEVAPDAARTECGGPGQPPCPDVFCTLPVTDAACTSAEIAVTEDGTLLLWTDRLATRGALSDPDYVVLDPLAGGTAPSEPTSRHGLEVRRGGTVQSLTFGIPGTFRLTSEEADGPDWLRRYDLVARGEQLAGVPLAAGDTLTRVLWTQLPGSRTPMGHPMYSATFGETYMVGYLGIEAEYTDPDFGSYEVLQFSDSSWGAPFTTVAGRFAVAEALRLVVTPDTLAPGDSATVALEGDVPGEAPVRLTVAEDPDGVPGGFVVVDPGLPTRTTATVGEAEIVVARSDLDRVRFVASADTMAVRTATVTAEVDGATATAEVVIEPGTLVIDPETFAPGEEAGLAFSTTLPGDTPIRLGVGQGTVARFVVPPPAARRANEEHTETSVRTTVAGVADVRLVGNEDIAEPTPFFVNWRTAEQDGRARGVVRPPEVFLLRQNDFPVPPSGGRSFVAVSKVRPDWLLPSAVGYASSAGPARFDNTGTADYSLHYDWDTYRPEVLYVADSLRTPEASTRYRFLYEVYRDGIRVYSNAADLAARMRFDTSPQVAVQDSSMRSLQPIRLVSNARPGFGAASGCASWPPANTGSPAPGGDCLYDDEVADGQTIPVRLGDEFRVTAYVQSRDGVSADTLGRVTFPVGQLSSRVGPDAVRRVDLVWHEYVENSGVGDRLTSEPDSMALRASEDWAQAAIYFESQGTPDSFSSADVSAILRVDLGAAGPPGSSGIAEVTVTLPDGRTETVQAPYPAIASAFEIAESLRQQLRTIERVGGGSLRVKALEGDSAGVNVAYVAVRRQDVQGLEPTTGSTAPIQNQIELLEAPVPGSEVASAASWTFSDDDLRTADVFVVPRLAIQRGDSTSARLAYAIHSDNPRLHITPEAVQGNDDESAYTLAHEAGHLLLKGGVPGVMGGPECDPSQASSHAPDPYNLMFCVALERGERVGGPKRLTRAQQIHAREVNSDPSVGLLKRP